LAWMKKFTSASLSTFHFIRIRLLVEDKKGFRMIWTIVERDHAYIKIV
jgi:hypothetical protein